MSRDSLPRRECTADREIVSTRVIAAPRARVFAAFSDPEQLVRWWGPRGFRNTCREFDLCPGGRWRLVMHGPDGTNHESENRFVTVVPGRQIVLRHEQTHHNFTLTMTFTTRGTGTELGWSMLFDSAAECALVKDVVVPANEENLDRLTAHLTRTTDQP